MDYFTGNVFVDAVFVVVYNLVIYRFLILPFFLTIDVHIIEKVLKSHRKHTNGMTKPHYAYPQQVSSDIKVKQPSRCGKKRLLS